MLAGTGHGHVLDVVCRETQGDRGHDEEDLSLGREFQGIRLLLTMPEDVRELG